LAAAKSDAGNGLGLPPSSGGGSNSMPTCDTIFPKVWVWLPEFALIDQCSANLVTLCSELHDI
jgi:hypothetical protein